MSPRIQQLFDACSAAMMSGYIISSTSYGVLLREGVWTPYKDSVCPLGALLIGNEIPNFHPEEMLNPIYNIHQTVNVLMDMDVGYSEQFSVSFIMRDCKAKGEPFPLSYGLPRHQAIAEIEAVALYTLLEREEMLGTKFDFQKNFLQGY